MRNTLFAWCVILGHAAFSQTWFGGSVVMKNGSVLTGDIALQLDQLILLRSKEGAMTVLPAHRVDFFRYFDDHENINRVFFSRSESKGGFMDYSFYESVVRGKINVWRKPVQLDGDWTEQTNFRYLVEWEGQLIQLKKFHFRVYPELIQDRAWLSAEMKSLNSTQQSDALQFIQWYNRNYAMVSIAGI